MAVKTPPCQEWSIREKLCLASAVMRSGDQNWMSVSRAIKPFPEPGRPSDWNTPKNCAIQYSSMLNEVDTPKRKRSGDKGDVVETPGDLIVKKMTFDRVEELKQMLADDRKKFKLLRDEIELIESGALDEKLPEILQDIKEKKRQAEEQKLAEEAAAAELLAKKEEQKKLPIVRKIPRQTEAETKDAGVSSPLEQKPSDAPDEAKETPKKVKEGDIAKDVQTTTPSSTTKQTTPTPVLLPKLLVSEKKEEKKETITKEQISDIEAMLAKPTVGKVVTPQADSPAPGEKEIAKSQANKKETPTLSKLLSTSTKSYPTPTQAPLVTVEAKSSGVQLKTKAAVTPKVPTVVEPEPKEEIQVTVVEEPPTDSPVPSSQLQIPGLENSEDSSDVSVVASTAPSSPAGNKAEDQKRRRRGRPTKKKVSVEGNEEDAVEVRSVSESADETKDGARSEAAESEGTERPSESDRDDASLSNAPIAGAFFTESLPNSPASQQSEDHQDQPDRQWKKAIMLVWREAASHKYANLFLHPVTDEIAPEYTSTVHRAMDLSTIKKNIESGTIRTTETFQRDIMLMFQNAIMYNRSDHDVYKMACDMQTDVLKTIEEFISTQKLVQNLDPAKSLRGRRTADLTLKEEDKPKRFTSEAEYTSGKKRKTRADEV
ncbi:bromodomain-containing protein 8-like isoform X1 [Apostichopus japonicus]|uniref:bromodomain-containing protein 8-like isoform X1 n=1 Tax=Stichopus japonicus TaxID=307972 RepID=UPI003AB5433B